MASDTGTVRYTKTPTGYLMVLLQGDNMFVQLEALMDSEQIPSASFSAFGFAKTCHFWLLRFRQETIRSRIVRERRDGKHYRNAGLERWQTFSSCARGRLRSQVRVRWRPSSGFRGRNWIT